MASGSIARLNIPQATLETAAGGNVTSFSWHVQVSDISATKTSATCTFAFDAAHPGKPYVPDAPADNTTTVGQPVTVHITPPTTGSLPGRYLYQLNAASPASVAADTTGKATLTITPTRLVNTLTVISVSPTGNIGDQANPIVIISDPPAATTPGDLTGDSIPDLLAIGANTMTTPESPGSALPDGLWQAQGKNDGQVFTNAVDIGANGDGSQTTNSPHDYIGAQAITGHFTDSGVQDILTYHPTGDRAGGGRILRGTGDGTTLQTQQNQNTIALYPGALSDLYDLNPLQVADAGHTSGQTATYDDLIAISGDTSNGYYLDYYPGPTTAAYYGFPYLLTNTTPTGGTDWNNWQLATTQTSGGTAIYLWNRTTGGLYLWTDLTLTDNGDLTATLTIGHPYTIHTTGWNTNTAITLHAADLNTDGAPDLWATSGGTVTAYLLTNLTPTGDTATLTARPAQTLTTANHAWPMADMPADAGGTAVDTTSPATDSTGNLDLTTTGTGTTRWNAGDAYSPDVILDGASALTTTGPAFDTNHDFTVSLWAKPDAYGGTVISQNSTNAEGFALYNDADSHTWTVAMANSDTATTSYDRYSASAPATPGLWTHLTVTYVAYTGRITLYVDGVMAATGTHTNTTWAATGPFCIGADRCGSAVHNFFTGQIADAQTWSQVAIPLIEAAKSQIVYFVSPHPDDVFQAWSLAQDSPSNYPVFISLTQGESTGYCKGSSATTLDVDYYGSFDRSTTAGCKGARIASLNNWLDDQSDTDAYLNDYVRAENTTYGYNMVKYVTTAPAATGTDTGAPTAAGMNGCTPAWGSGGCTGSNPNAGAPIPDNLNAPNGTGPTIARQVTWYVGPTSARVQFDLGDGNLTDAEVVWALNYVRTYRATFLPLTNEYAVIAAAYSNLNGVYTACTDYSHHDHRAVQEAVHNTDLIPDPGTHPQWGPTCGSQTTTTGVPALPGGRSNAITTTHYTANMANITSSFQKRFNWLHGGTLWPSGTDPTGGVIIARWNYFWRTF